MLAAPILVELGYAVVPQWCFVVGLLQIATGRKAGWNDVPRPAHRTMTGWLPVLTATGSGLLLPTAVLYTDWYLALSYWVAFNTLVFAAITLVQLAPPVRGAGQRPVTSPVRTRQHA